MNALDVRRFPLHGSRLIEASAGTGKTYTIALLYVRLVLGHGGEQAFVRPLLPPEILVVTFTDAATQELRERIRARLTEAAAVFAGIRTVGTGDPLAELLEDYSEAERPACALKLQRAAEWMDEAAVSTIHSWCYRMLREHAFDSGSLFTQELVTDQSELRAEVAQDYWRQHFYPLADSAQALAVLEAFAGPQALLGAVAPLLDRQGIAVRHAGEQLPDLQDMATVLALAGSHHKAQQQWQLQRDELERQARLAWRQQVDEVEQLLWAVQPDLNGKTHESNPEKFAALLSACRAWSEGGEAPTKLLKFATGQFVFKGKSPPPEPVHTVFDRLAAIVQHDGLAPDEPSVPLKAFLTRHAAQWIAQRLQQQLQQRAELGYDDLLRRLDVALGGEGGEQFAATVCRQFPVALIDEFQDTDPLQYRIFNRIYRVEAPRADTALVMIGDPKQAIYAFRGADIHTYLQARAATAGRHYSLARNFRSTSAVVDAVNTLFTHAEQHERAAFRFREAGNNPLPFTPVTANSRSEQLQIDSKPVQALTFWYQSPPGPGGVVNVGQYRHGMAAIAASEIVRWLHLAQQQRAGFVAADGTFTSLRPADIAILVRTGKEAAVIRAALRRRGVASVYLSDRDSVFASSEARDTVLWLQACAEPGNDRRIRTALATRSLGLSLQQLDIFNHDELAWETEVMRFRAYRECWQRSGVLPMLRRLLADFDVPARILQQEDGERALTNLLHLAEWLQQASSHLDGEQALIRHLAEQIAQPTDEQILRLESDADLIRVVTIHKSKGLEYPLVLLPFVCSWKNIDGKHDKVIYHHGSDGVTMELAGIKQAAEAYLQADDERLAEDMRLLYVALTRARHALWLGVAPLAVGNSKAPQLHKGAWGYLLAGGAPVSSDELPAQLAAFSAMHPAIATVDAPAADDAVYVAPPLPALGQARSPAGWQAETWWIASYSALHTVAHDAVMHDVVMHDVVPPEPEDARQSTATEENTVCAAEPLAGRVSIPRMGNDIHGFPRGARPGTFLHGVLEWAALSGFARVASDRALREDAIARRCNRRGWEHWITPLTDWLGELLLTPLSLDGAVLQLSQLSVYQPELEFWFASHRVDTLQLDRLVTGHTLAAAARLPLRPHLLNGMLKGFVDLVFEQDGRYFVADWKSNWLGPDASAYTAAALRTAVLAHRYELQYALYVLALHRQLKNRLPDYDYDRHIGGAAYVFLRGIHNPDTRGVHFEKPSRTLIEALDTLFSGAAFAGSAREYTA